jgi:ABC-type sugar transport system ATPase subunit
VSGTGSSSVDGGGGRPAQPVLLSAHDLEKSFGGTRALRSVSIDFRAAEVHAIVGENGAGKSTLVKILSGFYPARSYGGEIRLEGRPLAIESIFTAEAAGIFLVPQDLQIVPRLSVAENLFLNRKPTHWLGTVRSGLMLSQAVARLREFGVDCDPTEPIAGLTTAQQQLVVIARAMMRGMRVLALDEPTAALTETETHVLFDHIFALRQRGIAIIYISHRLDEITRVADKITVLRDGLVVHQVERGDPRAVARGVVRAMVGRDVDLSRRGKAVRREEMLALRGLSATTGQGERARRLSGIELAVHGGEVVGVFGAVGCGSAELVEAILGVAGGTLAGEIRVSGRPVRLGGPAEAMRHGIGYLPADRQRNAAFADLAIEHNLDILVLHQLSRLGVIRPGRRAELVSRFIRRFRIKARSPEDPLRTLSGGNQQKVMLSRVLSREPDIFIFHEPTQGVDIAAKEELYQVIDSLAQEGKAILVVSSDLEEIMMTSDRIVVLRQGSVVGSWAAGDATQEDILTAATGG